MSGTRIVTFQSLITSTSSRNTYNEPDQITVQWWRDSNNTPGFYGIKKLGGILPHQKLLYTKHTVKNTVGSVQFRIPGESIGTTSGSLKNTGYWVAPWRDQVQENKDEKVLRDNLILALRLDIKDQKANFANLAAERNQIIDLFASTAKNFASAISKLRKGDFAGAARDVGAAASKRSGKRFRKEWIKDRAKASANAWISLQYGWKPLIDECQGMAETLAKHENNFARMTSKVSKGRTHNYSKTESFSNCDSTSNVTVELFCKGTVVFEGDTGASALLAQIGLTNPLSPAWELVPWSFIVDWFLPVGNLIASLDATLGLHFITGSITTSKQMNAFRGDSYSRQGFAGYAYSSRQELDIARMPLIDFPEVPMIHFKNPISLMHSLNALALAVQRIR